MTSQRCLSILCGSQQAAHPVPSPSRGFFLRQLAPGPQLAHQPCGLVLHKLPMARQSSAAAAAARDSDVSDHSPSSGRKVTSHFVHHGIKYSFEAGALAQLADGSCLAKVGNTWVQAVVSWSEKGRFHERSKPTVHVDYREPLSSVGKMPGGRFKTEGGPNDRELETAMLIEQAVMPLFPTGFVDNVQITATVLCTDGMVEPGSTAINAVSAALMQSSIPWLGPIAAVQVAYTDSDPGPSQPVIQPNARQLEGSNISGLYVATSTSCVLADFQATGPDMSIEGVKALLQAAHASTAKLLNAQQKLLPDQTADAPSTATLQGCDPAAWAAIAEIGRPLMAEVLQEGNADMSPVQRLAALQNAKDSTVAKLTQRGIFRNMANRQAGSGCANQTDVDWAWHSLQRQAIHRMIAEDNRRLDGRGLLNARKASYQVGVLPVVHGSALVSQGASQALVTATVGDSTDLAKSEGITGDQTKALMVQLNDRTAAASQASTSGRLSDGARNRLNGSHSRALERSLKAIMPSTSFPFAVRLTAELLAADGSEATTALGAAALALADAGVPVEPPLAGTQVAAFTSQQEAELGSEAEADDHVLCDIIVDPQELESQASDMLMQVAGSQEGMTGVRVEVQQQGGVPLQVLHKALNAAWRGLQDQHTKLQAQAQKRAHEGNNFGMVSIPQEMVGRLIGPRGSNINKLRASTGALVSIQEDNNQPNASVHIFCSDSRRLAEAVQSIKGVTGADLLVGSIHTVTVKKMLDFGAMVEFPTGSSTLLHISNLSHTRVRSVMDVLSMGQQIQVKVMGHDAKGHLQVSHKALTAPGQATASEDVANSIAPEAEASQNHRYSSNDDRHQKRFKPRIPRT